MSDILETRDERVGSNELEHPLAADGTRRRGGCSARTVAVFGLFVGVLVVVVLMLSGGQTTDDGQAASLVLSPDELAAVAGASAGDYDRSSSPVDMGTAERAARATTMGKVPEPRSRHLSTNRHTASGAEITQAVILFDDAAAAAELGAAAAPLLGATFGLMYEPYSMPNVDEAILWTSSRFRAVTFRHGGSIVLIGSTDTTSGDTLDLWVNRLLEKVMEMELQATRSPRSTPLP